MAKYIRVETSTTGRKRYMYACEKCGSEVWRYTRSTKRIICAKCRKAEEREKQKQRQDAKIKEAHDKGYADAIDEIKEHFKPCNDCKECEENDREYFKKNCELDIQIKYTELCEYLEQLKEQK